VGALAAAGIVASLMQALVVPLVPELPELLGTSASNASWAITATLLAGAVATPVVGRLGDLYGKRRMLLVSLFVLVAGSVICALADSLVPVVIGRALQGTSMGIIALGISIMRDAIPPERLGSGMALMSSSLGIGAALGIPGAALVAENADWHALFWASAGLGLLVALLVWRIVPASPTRPGGRFDAIGAPRVATGVGAAAPRWGCSPPRPSSCCCGARTSCACRSRSSTSAPAPAVRCWSPIWRPSWSVSRCTPPCWCPSSSSSSPRRPATGWASRWSRPACGWRPPGW
jgi:MFS family permease